MNIKQICTNDLKEVANLLSKLTNEQYQKSSEYLFKATIGQHVRHILEFYQCLFHSENNIVAYDKRERNINIEIKSELGIIIISELLEKIKAYSQDHSIQLEANPDVTQNENSKYQSSFNRELIYCLEHSIHHKALIKVALKEFQLENMMDENFGIAPSTVRHKNELTNIINN